MGLGTARRDLVVQFDAGNVIAGRTAVTLSREILRDSCRISGVPEGRARGGELDGVRCLGQGRLRLEAEESRELRSCRVRVGGVP